MAHVSMELCEGHAENSQEISIPALLMMRRFSSTTCDGSGSGGRSSCARVTISFSWSEEHSTEADEVVDVEKSGELHAKDRVKNPGLAPTLLTSLAQSSALGIRKNSNKCTYP